jgi:uncharacterized protein
MARRSTDLAMPFGDLKLSRFVVASDELTLRSSGARRRVLFSTRVARPTVVSESVWTAIEREQISPLPQGVLSALVEGGILVGRDEDELAAVLRENTAAIVGNEVLKHVIQPTAACQLGCDYCGQQHFARHLAEDHQDMLLARLNRRLASGCYSSLAISWFGAEPLLGIKAMRRLSPMLIGLAQHHKAAYSSRMVTNGLRLTPDIARELEIVHRVGAAEITLDGPEAVHDQRRYVKNGQPSFARILGNLVAIAGLPEIAMQLSVRCNVDRRNADSVGELIDVLYKEGLHTRVSLHFAPVYSWGNGADADALAPDDFGAREIEWFAQMQNRGFQVDLLPGRQRIVCLAVHREGELTDALGNLFNCTEVSQVPAYGEPNRFGLGTLDREDVVAQPPFRNFNDEIAQGDHPQCGTCRMLPVCGGACPKQWSEGRSPCPSARANISERLTLWYATQQM